MRSSGLMIVGEPDVGKAPGVKFTLIARAHGTRELSQLPPLPERPFLLHVPACSDQRAAALPVQYALSQCAVDAAYQRALRSWLAAVQPGGPIDARAQLDLT